MGAARMTAASAAKKVLAALEPWYDWGTVTVERLQELRMEGDRIVTGGEGDVSYFMIQWFGIHVQVQIGRTPKREG